MSLPLSVLGQIVPAGTTFSARLSDSTGSRISHAGDAFSATLIAPITLQGSIVIPQGTIVRGTVREVVPIGLGIRHRTASIRYQFNSFYLPGGETLPISANLLKVEAAKERVDSEGVVVGVHPGANLSSASGIYTLPLLFVNPVFGFPLWGVKALIAPPTSPEIYFPPGAELLCRLNEALDASSLPRFPGQISALSPNEKLEANRVLQSSHSRAESRKKPSDVVNLLMIGTRRQIDSAFQAAGWVTAERGSPISLYKMYNALTKRIGYRKAPMKTLLLNGRRSDFVYQKSLNNLAERHHARFWKQSPESDVWFGTATEDVALCFRRMHWTHRIDPAIDGERAKIVNDLAFTGCVKSAELVSGSSRAEGPIVTDGDVAVVRFNSCENPTIMPGVEAQNASAGERWLPRMILSFRNDVMKSNPVFTAFNTVRCLTAKQSAKPPARNLNAPDMTLSLDWVRGRQYPVRGTNE